MARLSASGKQRTRLAIGFLMVLLMAFFLTSGAGAADRVALVIGNQRYAMAPLETPEADARAMAERLTRAGYQVTRRLDLRQSEFYDAIDNFFKQNQNAKVLLFYYAGHAMQINGKNFLIPVDIRDNDPDLLSRMFDLRYLMGKLTESGIETKVVVLDSCRNNIFSSHPNAASGLSELISPPGSFVAFSTAPGSTAEDGEGENSPYTTALLEILFRPRVKIEDAFKEVRRRVRALTKNAQTPWESTSLEQDFFMVPAVVPGPRPSPAGRNPPAPTPATAERDGGSEKDKKYCTRILTKLSMGMDPLSEEENMALSKCRQ